MPSSGERKKHPGVIETLTLPVDGMTCASCVARVEKALKKVDGVTAAAVNLATEKATIEFDPGKATIEKLQAAVSDSGYTLKPPATEVRIDEANRAGEHGMLAGPAAQPGGISSSVLLSLCPSWCSVC